MTAFDALTRRSAAALIAGYQQHLSPRKGFSCAYRALHGGEPCSQYIKRTILEVGLIEAVRASRHRLQACKFASFVLKSRMQTPEPPEKDAPSEPPWLQPRRRDSWRDKSGAECVNGACDCAGAGCEAIDCSGSLGDACAGCHQIHCGAIDCGAADCSVLHCASCGG
jgi:putative component of membrane protein insertase Oxa1/YidC/SpoIIIJ protein YidD